MKEERLELIDSFDHGSASFLFVDLRRMNEGINQSIISQSLFALRARGQYYS